jgi:integrase
MRKIETGIWQMEDGRYRVRTTGKSPETGKIVSREATVESIDEAREVREAIKRDIKAKMSTGSAAQIITVADYAERWLGERAKRLKPSTLSGYELALACWILPQLGHLKVKSIVRHDIAQWVGWMEEQRKPPSAVVHLQRRIDRGTLDDKEGAVMIAAAWKDAGPLERYATESLRAHWRVLVTMMRDAHADGYIADDPTIRVSPPDTGVRGRRETGTLSADDLGRLVALAREVHPRRYAEIVTLAYTGMRSGELYALKWDDIEDGRIVVSRSVWKGVVGKTKTGASREVPLTDLVVEALDDHRRALIREQHAGLDSGLIFPSTTGGYRVQSSITKPLSELAEHLRIKQNVSPQVLRRTFNTLLVMSGVDRIAIRAIMGHMEEEMTERYSGVGIEAKRLAVLRAFEREKG